MPTPAIPSSLSRRAAFRLTAGAALTTIAVVTSTACSSDDNTAATLDTLTTHLRLARADAATAGSLIAILPDRAAALAVVQSERGAHAESLATEIDRVAGTGASTTSTAATTTAAAPVPTLDELIGGLADSGRSAAESARNESGYRAGLLGSISAACTVEREVVLA